MAMNTALACTIPSEERAIGDRWALAGTKPFTLAAQLVALCVELPKLFRHRRVVFSILRGWSICAIGGPCFTNDFPGCFMLQKIPTAAALAAEIDNKLKKYYEEAGIGGFAGLREGISKL